MQEKITSIHNLPFELVIEILLNLTKVEDLFNSSLVCRAWRTVTQRPEFFNRNLFHHESLNEKITYLSERDVGISSYLLSKEDQKRVIFLAHEFEFLPNFKKIQQSSSCLLISGYSNQMKKNFLRLVDISSKQTLGIIYFRSSAPSIVKHKYSLMFDPGYFFEYLSLDITRKKTMFGIWDIQSNQVFYKKLTQQEKQALKLRKWDCRSEFQLNENLKPIWINYLNRDAARDDNLKELDYQIFSLEDAQPLSYNWELSLQEKREQRIVKIDFSDKALYLQHQLGHDVLEPTLKKQSWDKSKPEVIFENAPRLTPEAIILVTENPSCLIVVDKTNRLMEDKEKSKLMPFLQIWDNITGKCLAYFPYPFHYESWVEKILIDKNSLKIIFSSCEDEDAYEKKGLSQLYACLITMWKINLLAINPNALPNSLRITKTGEGDTVDFSGEFLHIKEHFSEGEFFFSRSIYSLETLELVYKRENEKLDHIVKLYVNQIKKQLCWVETISSGSEPDTITLKDFSRKNFLFFKPVNLELKQDEPSIITTNALS